MKVSEDSGRDKSTRRYTYSDFLANARTSFSNRLVSTILCSSSQISIKQLCLSGLRVESTTPLLFSLKRKRLILCVRLKISFCQNTGSIVAASVGKQSAVFVFYHRQMPKERINGILWVLSGIGFLSIARYFYFRSIRLRVIRIFDCS